jgi:hypothetical protein
MRPEGSIEPKEDDMDIFSKLCVAGLARAAVAAATLASNANVGFGDVAAATLSANSGATMIALNPQPLPPGDREDDFDFRG